MACLAVLIWGMNKGFDFSDEGFSMLSLNPGQEQGLEIMPVYLLLQKLFSWLNPGIVFYRLLRLILYLSGTAVFIMGLLSYLRCKLSEINWPPFSIAYPVAALTGLINYACFYQSLSYNSLTLIMILMMAGFLFRSLGSFDSASGKRQIVFLMATGLCCGMLCLIKLSSGILFSAASLLLIFSFPHNEEKLKVRLEFVVSFISGFAVSGLLFYAAGYSPVEFINNIRIAADILPGHQISELLEVYLEDLHKNFFKIIIYHKIYLLIPVLLWVIYKKAYILLFVTVFSVCCLLLMQQFVSERWFKAGMEGMYSASLVYILLMWSFFTFLLIELLTCLRRKWNNQTHCNFLRVSPAFIFFFFCPFVASAGTNNPFSVHITQFLFFWMVIFLLITEIVSNQNSQLKIIRPVFVFVLIIIVCSQFVFGFIVSPYRLNQGLAKQSFKMTTGSNSGSVLLDESSYNFTTAVINILKKNGYENGNYSALSLYNFPGLLYLAGSNSPGAAWYFGDGYPGNDRANCFMIAKTKMTDLKRTVIFKESEKPVSTMFSECLKTKGILFPENYICADSVLIPDSSGYLKIYLPH